LLVQLQSWALMGYNCREDAKAQLPAISANQMPLPRLYLRWSLVASLRLSTIALSLFALIPAALSDDSLDFARDVRPILSDRCFFCHGPDAGQRQADLRLDEQSSAHEWVIVPGEPDESELIRRIFSDDPTDVMPPPEAKRNLSEAEKATLRQWVEQGAEYEGHWAFTSLQRPDFSGLTDTAGSQHGYDWEQSLDLLPIDFFVRSRLAAEGMEPSPEAERSTLIRRVTLDLTGLPPTIEEVDQFLADTAPGAYGRLVDRLLQSPRFGERMAVDWLDVARYADTYGYQNDRYRPTWPWRDWVVRAFNDNLPYDQFITWQIAGDLLPDATRDQILATAFQRHHRQTNEGGSIEQEFRAEYVADRVNTFGAAFLGLTLECARCHDHKYDPISQREYYQLAAFFNSIDESGLYSHFTEATPTPTLLLASDDQLKALSALKAELKAREKQLEDFQVDDEQYSRWRSSLEDTRSSSSSANAESHLSDLLDDGLKDSLIGDFPLEEIEDGKVVNRVEGAEGGKTSDDPQSVPGKIGQGVLLSGDNNISVKPGGDFTRNQPFSVSLWINAAQHYPRAVVFHRSRAWTDSGSRGYELLIEDGKLNAALIHFWPGNAMCVKATHPLPLGRWVQVTVTYDGSSRAAGLKIFVDGAEANVTVVRDKLTKHIKGADGSAGDDADELAIGQRFRDSGLKDGRVDELKVFDRELSPLEVQFLFVRDASPETLPAVLHNASEENLRDYYRRSSPEYAQLQDKLRRLRDKFSQQHDDIPEHMVMREEPQPRPTFVLMRGAYDAPTERVDRGMPAALSRGNAEAESSAADPAVAPLNADQHQLQMARTAPNDRAAHKQLDRLDLARWLIDPEHPLTARVAVNRFWQMLFGRGIVFTSEDFGLQGSQPSHPELLDWLAVEFVESGWDVKHLIKTIVTSHTYRQSSDVTSQLMERDPENLLLARGPVQRLPAEMIRDGALAASGLLLREIGGPPVKPYQPDGLWEEKSGEVYRRDAGAGSHRRSMYTFWKRTSPPPAMMTFDASNREVCVVRRQATMTPLQVLVLLNDPQYVEAARALAEAAMHAAPELDGQLDFVFRSLISRRCKSGELAVLRSLYQAQHAIFEAAPEDAEQYLKVGDHRADEQLHASELAAMTVVAQALMAHDEAVMKR
jgi:hypothetical protein